MISWRRKEGRKEGRERKGVCLYRKGTGGRENGNEKKEEGVRCFALRWAWVDGVESTKEEKREGVRLFYDWLSG